MMKVVFIGAGNVATRLAKELYKKSFDIIQIYSQTMNSASVLAEEVQAIPVADISTVINDADLYIFSVKDSALENLISKLPKNNGLWIHTAGSMPMDVFKGYALYYGVLYPFQTFSKSRDVNWAEVPVFTEGSNDYSREMLHHIARQLSSKVMDLSTEDRKFLHLTGVFACNFTNHMYMLSKQILQRINLPFDVALPLIDETAEKVHLLSPEKAPTGPAIRYDENVINKHLSLIEDEKIKQLYRLISEDIHRFGK
jgi:predicted short-subunit dehydrogenase-like oxidoreductase (DUF2520 family)